MGCYALGNAAGTLDSLNPLIRDHHILTFLPFEFQGNGKLIGALRFLDLDMIVPLVWLQGSEALPLASVFACLISYLTQTMVCNLRANLWRKISGIYYVLGFDQKMGVVVVLTPPTLLSRLYPSAAVIIVATAAQQCYPVTIFIPSGVSPLGGIMIAAPTSGTINIELKLLFRKRDSIRLVILPGLSKTR
ncbi:hypothetical protein GH714_022128 [Hevea brasiliensis]|uniref:Uncharacterized protein n=1 Tax=Hevea brasiliensis TaxID=3981 RepID=A0A6A6MK14_HEVBR|nr:hypothetical protein GH714_022128 [Hevea brasiliensis]